MFWEEDISLVDDREDLIALLRMRFGEIKGEVIEAIYKIDQLDTLQTLIMTAANAPNWSTFLKEFQTSGTPFMMNG